MHNISIRCVPLSSAWYLPLLDPSVTVDIDINFKASFFSNQYSLDDVEAAHSVTFTLVVIVLRITTMRTAGVDVAALRKYKCGACSTEFKQYRHLVCHLYWRHGTESLPCSRCPVRRWEYALHICNVLPYDDLAYGDEPAADVGSVASSSGPVPEQRDSIYCSCGKEVPGAHMIGCDGDHCTYQWYHFTCVGITEAPDGKWFCPTCADR
ncbi:unnamed protein product [Diatraea saccharalis]|uniref:PHD-type domain-containing protein n=1 Tax=Diatraea saccharalis TaxID=40085 RepID=A0A9N9WFU8_9NEOP|nr:unnamed protein product [Diatraea saccharalis]